MPVIGQHSCLQLHHVVAMNSLSLQQLLLNNLCIVTRMIDQQLA